MAKMRLSRLLHGYLTPCERLVLSDSLVAQLNRIDDLAFKISPIPYRWYVGLYALSVELGIDISDIGGMNVVTSSHPKPFWPIKERARLDTFDYRPGMGIVMAIRMALPINELNTFTQCIDTAYQDNVRTRDEQGRDIESLTYRICLYNLGRYIADSAKYTAQNMHLSRLVQMLQWIAGRVKVDYHGLVQNQRNRAVYNKWFNRLNEDVLKYEHYFDRGDNIDIFGDLSKSLGNAEWMKDQVERYQDLAHVRSIRTGKGEIVKIPYQY